MTFQLNSDLDLFKEWLSTPNAQQAFENWKFLRHSGSAGAHSVEVFPSQNFQGWESKKHDAPSWQNTCWDEAGKDKTEEKTQSTMEKFPMFK